MKIVKTAAAILLFGAVVGFRWGTLGLHASTLARAHAQRTDVGSLLSTADSVFREMSELTGLPIKAPLTKRVVNREQVRKYLVETFHAENSPSDIHQQEAVLRAFGLVSRDFNLEKFLIGFYTEQAAGVYDPQQKTMYIADWVEPVMQEMVLSHELTHALQDQNFNLDRFLHAVKGDDDATAARQSLVEGYATAAMMERTIKPMSLDQMPSIAPLMDRVVSLQMQEFPEFSKAPFFFKYEALFPYTQGLGFAQKGITEGGWERLNEAFRNPPKASLEIASPELYFDRLGEVTRFFDHRFSPAVRLTAFRQDDIPERPGASVKNIILAPVALPHPPALDSVPGLHVVSENAMGEMGYYGLLGQLVSEDEAKRVAPAWLGDRYLVYEGDGQKGRLGDLVLIARSRWQSEDAAADFFKDYESILHHKYAHLAADRANGADRFLGTTDSGSTVLLRHGTQCLWAEGVPPAHANAIEKWLASMMSPD
jgi:hypothetical protein